MPDNRGHLLPVYVLADESYSMKPYQGQLSAGMLSLCEALRSQPMVAAKVRLSVIGFSTKVAVRLAMADLRNAERLPSLQIGGGTNYHAAFSDLLKRIPQDISSLKSGGYQVHRPAVFFLSDGQPDSSWHRVHKKLTDRAQFGLAPNIIACGIGAVEARTIVKVATQPDFAFVSVPGADLGADIAKFFMALTASVIQSGRSLASENPELVVEKPEGFRMAIDVI